uniref:Uncharacterized protein n=1 Tax=Chromera velia CCMP2878 TaxID=1169474 RepID=A0A0G4I3F3_9ALVE|eukprot:Cvel_10666.t1-p1 / transcript=Cvel_10666.t1 / gene=Cvel_10666 / organism=Chromera_velia_CCMP2878 / gene_product=hypothetical protein / transcript_product=hypothetical protein / location=Cvel_scaffold648:46464-46925(-) / protein_length=154 / sequence_SO=supercontig / SO=protein_coding / is_pseudo=false
MAAAQVSLTGLPQAAAAQSSPHRRPPPGWPLVKVILEHLIPHADEGFSTSLCCGNYGLVWLLLYALKRGEAESCGSLEVVEFSPFFHKAKMAVLVAFFPPSVRHLRFRLRSLSVGIARSLSGLLQSQGLPLLEKVLDKRKAWQCTYFSPPFLLL